MKEFPLVISFYTQNTYYQWEAYKLIESCEKFGMENHIEAIDSFGSWELNCAYKPFFIYQQLQKWKRPVFWVDVDAVFLRKPTDLAFLDADLAVRINEGLGQDHPSYVMSGSLYANYTKGGEKILRLWAEECRKQITAPERTQEFWDQIALRDVMIEGGNMLLIHSLSKAYTKISGHFLDEKEIQEAVIEHSQASRRYKNLSQ